MRYLIGTDAYPQYTALTSDLAHIDIGLMAARIADLARDPGLRARMGAAGRKRARLVFDWAAIVPAMQDLWAEQDAVRRRAIASGVADPQRGALIPTAPPALSMFAAYPSAQIAADLTLYRLRPGAPLSVAEMVELRAYDRLKRMTEPAEVLERVAARLGDGQSRDTAWLAEELHLSRQTVERAILWLLKYGFVETVSARPD
ncbi:hypothetical protein [Paracoccus pacificus]|uniref:Uncharacterized protein n=1 Tax=Paracoccus pacificus TaxID=1463598 RepID=A0ABW4R728_9RHOB